MTVFKDEAKAWPMAVQSIRRVAAAGLLTGDPDGHFRPTDPVSRQEMALIIDRYMLQEHELEDAQRIRLLQQVANSVVEVRAGGSLGSGVVISQQGHILTNAHVVGDSTAPEVLWKSVYADGDRYPRFVGPACRVLAVDKENDLALIQTHMTTEPAPLATGWVDPDHTNRTYIGRRLLVQGSPLAFGGRATECLFNGVRSLGSSTYLDLDGAVNPGNSGGPIFNTAGQLVGIVVAKLVAVDIESFGLGIPLARIMPFLEAAGFKGE